MIVFTNNNAVFSAVLGSTRNFDCLEAIWSGNTISALWGITNPQKITRTSVLYLTKCDIFAIFSRFSPRVHHKKNARIIRSLFTRTWRVQVYRRRQILITRNNNRTCLRDGRSRRLHCTQIAVYDARGKREEVTPEQVRMLAPRSTAEASTLGAYFWLHTR